MNLFEKVYKKSDSIVSRKIADEFLLVPIKQNVGDLESIYTLNEVATRVWERIDGKKKVKEIQDKIVEEFEVTPQEAEKDLASLVKQLLAVGAIKKVQ